MLEISPSHKQTKKRVDKISSNVEVCFCSLLYKINVYVIMIIQTHTRTLTRATLFTHTHTLMLICIIAQIGFAAKVCYGIFMVR